MKDTMRDKIKAFCKAFGLGTVNSEIRPVSGGLLHTMYRVETETGMYAVKVLNPEIMQRPEALQNMVNSEKIAQALEGLVPVVAAKKLNGAHVVEYGGSWCMVFEWLEGTSVFAPEITTKHCAKIGELLGIIHAADMKIEGMEPETEVRDVFAWEKLCGTAKISALEAFLPELSALDAEVVRALRSLSFRKVISHRDLDPKNVMWQGDNPYIIDWEAAGYVNPYQELAEALNYWITDADGNYNFEKFAALMQAYTTQVDIRGVDWETVLLCSFDGILGWLEYNMRRAAGVLGNDDADRAEGRKQTGCTIAEIKRQKMQMVRLVTWLKDMV